MRWVCLVLAGVLVAGGARGQGVNPLGAAAGDPVVGVFVGEKFTLVLKAQGAGTYSGVIRMGAKQWPASASGDGRGLRGSFVVDGNSFEFSTVLDGGKLTLSTGGATHVLKREENPLGAAKNVNGGTAAAAGKFEVLQSTQTGQTLFAARDGARSAAGLLASAVADLTAYLGVKPNVAGAFADKKDLRGGASFTAKVRDRSIKGMIFVGVGERGGAVTVVFDAADAPARNLGALAVAAAPVEAKWEDATLPDGSGTMRLPAGWRITSAAKGAVDVVGPDGQSIGLGLAYPVNTPAAEQAWLQSQTAAGIAPRASGLPVAPFPDNAAAAVEVMAPVFSRMVEASGGPAIRLAKIVEWTPTQHAGGQAGFVHAIIERGRGEAAVRYHSVAAVVAAPTGGGQWLYYTSFVSAPEQLFARDLPTMVQIWGSWKVSDRVFQERLKQAMSDLKSAGETYKRSTEAASRIRERANADFSEVIRGYRTVEDTLTGERREADLGNVDRIVERMNEREGYERYKPIPLRGE